MASPDQRVDQLRERVEEQQEELRYAVEELEVAARRTLDPRHWIQTRPFLCIAGAFLAGFWFGGRRI